MSNWSLPTDDSRSERYVTNPDPSRPRRESSSPGGVWFSRRLVRWAFLPLLISLGLLWWGWSHSSTSEPVVLPDATTFALDPSSSRGELLLYLDAATVSKLPPEQSCARSDGGRVQRIPKEGAEVTEYLGKQYRAYVNLGSEWGQRVQISCQGFRPSEGAALLQRAQSAGNWALRSSVLMMALTAAIILLSLRASRRS